jgi:hypothetical protein
VKKRRGILTGAFCRQLHLYHLLGQPVGHLMVILFHYQVITVCRIFSPTLGGNIEMISEYPTVHTWCASPSEIFFTGSGEIEANPKRTNLLANLSTPSYNDLQDLNLKILEMEAVIRRNRLDALNGVRDEEGRVRHDIM